MSEKPLSPSVDELRIRQFEAELDSRERMAKAAESEINRVWEAYGRIAKLSAVFLVLAGGVAAFLGIKTFSDIREEAKKEATEEVGKMREEAKTATSQEVEKTREAVREELDRQFSTDSIKQLVADKAKERIDSVVVPVVNQMITTNFARIGPVVGEIIATNFNAWERNIYSDYASQFISGSDSNRVTILKYKDGVSKVFFRLDNAAIERSIRATVTQPEGQSIIPDFGVQGNVAFTFFTPAVDINTATFMFTYARDKSTTNAFRKVEVIGNKVFMDGVQVLFHGEDIP